MRRATDHILADPSFDVGMLFCAETVAFYLRIRLVGGCWPGASTSERPTSRRMTSSRRSETRPPSAVLRLTGAGERLRSRPAAASLWIEQAERGDRAPRRPARPSRRPGRRRVQHRERDRAESRRDHRRRDRADLIAVLVMPSRPQERLHLDRQSETLRRVCADRASAREPTFSVPCLMKRSSDTSYGEVSARLVVERDDDEPGLDACDVDRLQAERLPAGLDQRLPQRARTPGP